MTAKPVLVISFIHKSIINLIRLNTDTSTLYLLVSLMKQKMLNVQILV